MPSIKNPSILPKSLRSSLTGRRGASALKKRVVGWLRLVMAGAGLFLLVLVSFSEIPHKLFQSLEEKFYLLTASHNMDARVFVIEGTFNLKKKDLIDTLALRKGVSLFSYEPHRLKEKAEHIPWVRSAKVQRLFPHTLAIKIAERVPIALWQKNKRLTLVDDQGNLMMGVAPEKFSYLPLVVGDKAPEKIPGLFAILSAEPHLQKRLKTAILISERRWDLVLDGGLQVKLPERDLTKALSHLYALEHNKTLTMKDVLCVDLRVPGRFYLRMKEKAVLVHRAKGTKSRV